MKTIRTFDAGVFTFTIPEHPEKPELRLNLSDYSSGDKILADATKWAKGYGSDKIERG